MAIPSSEFAHKFHAAASYAGLDETEPSKGPFSKFKNADAFKLCGYYLQATVGPCCAPKSHSKKNEEDSDWKGCYGIGDMAPTEAMRLFVKTLEKVDPAWYSMAGESATKPTVDVEITKGGSQETREPLMETFEGKEKQWGEALFKEQSHALWLKEELIEAEIRNSDLLKELRLVRHQLAAEKSRCFNLEIVVAELCQKLGKMEAFQKEFELLQQQKAASEEAASTEKQ